MRVERADAQLWKIFATPRERLERLSMVQSWNVNPLVGILANAVSRDGFYSRLRLFPPQAVLGPAFTPGVESKITIPRGPFHGPSSCVGLIRHGARRQTKPAARRPVNGPLVFE